MTTQVIFNFLKEYGLVFLPFAGALGGLLGYAIRKRSEKQKEKARESFALKRLNSILRNIERHYKIVLSELNNLVFEDKGEAIVQLKKQKVTDLHMFRLNDDDWQYLSDELSSSALSLAMFIRNNDLHIDHLIELISSGNGDQERERGRLVTRLDRGIQRIGTIRSALLRDKTTRVLMTSDEERTFSIDAQRHA
jgi:hypothetical protein